MPGNMSNLMKQAQRMQRQMEESAKELEIAEFTATAGGGVVTAVVSGKKTLLSLEIKPELVNGEDSDIEMLQDLIVSAVNEAVNQVEETTESEMSKITGGVSLPGLF